MKLSKILNKYHVIPLVGSEMVGYCIMHRKPTPTIDINFTVDDEEHSQVFADQEIQIMNQPPGAFSVTDVNGEQCGFIALDGVDLRA